LINVYGPVSDEGVLKVKTNEEPMELYKASDKVADKEMVVGVG
jgi:hypothetical protein